MMHALLWCETLALAAVCGALLVALAQRLRHSRRRSLLLCAAAVLPVLPLVLLAALAWILHADRISTPVWPLSTLTLLGLAVAVVLIARGWAARYWPRRRLGIALVATLILTMTTFTQIEQTTLLRVAARGSEGFAIGLAMLPARLPDEMNAAIPYGRAVRALEQVDLPDLVGADLARTWTDEDPRWSAPELSTRMQEWDDALDLLVAGSARPGCWFERDLSAPSLFAIGLPEISGLTRGSRLLQMRSRMRAATRQDAGAWQDAVALGRLAYHYQDEPFLISRLIAAAIDGHAFRSMAVCLRLGLAHGPLAADALPEPLSWQTSLRRGLVADQAAGMQTMQLVASGSEEFRWVQRLSASGDSFPLRSWINRPASRLYTVLLLESDLTGYLDAVEELQRAADEGLASYRATVSRLHATRSERGGAGMLASLLLPAVDGVANHLLLAEAQRSLLRLALEARGHHVRHGAWPEPGSAIPGEDRPGSAWPRDPYAEAPLRAAIRDGELVLWSIGPDGADDGGLKECETAPGQDPQGDVILRVAPPRREPGPR